MELHILRGYVPKAIEVWDKLKLASNAAVYKNYKNALTI